MKSAMMMMTSTMVLAMAIAIVANPAFAGKDVFERTKPHLNYDSGGSPNRGNALEDDQRLVQFKIQMGTSDLQNAESTRSKRNARKRRLKQH